jgi:hypothetical protein
MTIMQTSDYMQTDDNYADLRTNDNCPDLWHYADTSADQLTADNPRHTLVS